MYTQEQKEFLQTEGYLLLDMKELYPDEFDEAEKVLDRLKENKRFNTLLTNHQHPSITDDILSKIDELGIEKHKHDELLGDQDTLEEFHRFMVSKGDYEFAGQVWFYSQVRDNLFYNFKKDMAKFFYDFTDEELSKISTSPIHEFTLYLPGSRTPEHQDGCETGRLLVFLTYFSKDYENGGGNFKFRDIHGQTQEIVPEYGKVLILDFTDKYDNPRNNLYHEVTPVKSFRRYCYLGSLNSLMN